MRARRKAGVAGGAARADQSKHAQRLNALEGRGRSRAHGRGRADLGVRDEVDDVIDRYGRGQIEDEPSAHVSPRDRSRPDDEQLLVSLSHLDDDGGAEGEGDVDGEAEVDDDVQPPFGFE